MRHPRITGRWDEVAPIRSPWRWIQKKLGIFREGLKGECWNLQSGVRVTVGICVLRIGVRSEAL